MRTYSIKYTQCAGAGAGGSSGVVWTEDDKDHLDYMMGLSDTNALENILWNQLAFPTKPRESLVVNDEFNIFKDGFEEEKNVFLNLKYENKTYHEYLLQVFESDGKMRQLSNEQLKNLIKAFMSFNNLFENNKNTIVTNNNNNALLIGWLTELREKYDIENQEWRAPPPKMGMPVHSGLDRGPPSLQGPLAAASATVFGYDNTNNVSDIAEVYTDSSQKTKVYGRPAIIKIIHGRKFITLNRHHAIELELLINKQSYRGEQKSPDELYIGDFLYNFGVSQQGVNQVIEVSNSQWEIIMDYLDRLSGQPRHVSSL